MLRKFNKTEANVMMEAAAATVDSTGTNLILAYPGGGRPLSAFHRSTGPAIYWSNKQ